MPTVPRYDSPQIRTAPLPGVRATPNAPEEAFGAGPSFDRLVDTGMRIFEEEKRKADQVAVMDADRRLAEMETSLQYDPNTGAMNRKGKDVLGIPDEVKEKWDKGVQEIGKSLSDGTQRAAFTQRVAARWPSLNGNIQRHVSSEISNYDTQATSSFIDNEREAAVANFLDPRRMDLSISRQKDALDQHAQRNGLPKEWIRENAAKYESATRRAVIARMLDADMNEAAKARFESDKGFFTAGDLSAVKDAVDRGAFRDEAVKTWDAVSGPKFLFPDGTFDVEKQRENIFSSDMPTERKERIFDYVKARSDEARVSLARKRDGIDRAFLNDLYATKKAGATLDDALKLAGKYGYDAYDMGVKEKAARDLYTTPGITDPAVYMALWENIRSKTSTRDEIDNAFTGGSINRQDWEGLRKEFWNSQFSGETPAEKDMRERVKMLAEATFGTEKDAKGLKKADEFLYTVRQVGQGKTPEEQWKIANDLLQKTVVKPRPFWFDKKAPAWEVELAKDDAQNAAWGQLNAYMGAETLKAIGRSAMVAGKSSWGLPDVQSFVNEVGGPDAVKAGAPANNAVQSLVRHGRLVTPDAVRKVLEVYRDGNF